MILPLRLALLALLFVSPAWAEEAVRVDALTLLGDWQPYLGQRVTVTGCEMTSATAETAQCFAKSKHGGTDSFAFEMEAVAAADVARAVADCYSYVAYPICGMQLTGEVRAKKGQLRIVDASVDWFYDEGLTHAHAKAPDGTDASGGQ